MQKSFSYVCINIYIHTHAYVCANTVYIYIYVTLKIVAWEASSGRGQDGALGSRSLLKASRAEDSGKTARSQGPLSEFEKTEGALIQTPK